MCDIMEVDITEFRVYHAELLMSGDLWIKTKESNFSSAELDSSLSTKR